MLVSWHSHIIQTHTHVVLMGAKQLLITTVTCDIRVPCCVILVGKKSPFRLEPKAFGRFWSPVL